MVAHRGSVGVIITLLQNGETAHAVKSNVYTALEEGHDGNDASYEGGQF